MFELNGRMVSAAAVEGSGMPCETPSPFGSGLFVRLVDRQLVQGHLTPRRQTGINGRTGQADWYRPMRMRDIVQKLLTVFLPNLGRCSASVILPCPCPSLFSKNSLDHGATFVPDRTFARSSTVKQFMKRNTSGCNTLLP